MVTAKRFAKLLAMSDEELRKEINKMQESDAKDLLYSIVSFLNMKNRESEGKLV